MESIYTELALYGRKICVLGFIMSFAPYLSSAMVRLNLIQSLQGVEKKGKLIQRKMGEM